MSSLQSLATLVRLQSVRCVRSIKGDSLVRGEEPEPEHYKQDPPDSNASHVEGEGTTCLNGPLVRRTRKCQFGVDVHRC